MLYLLNPRMWIATAIFTALLLSHFASYKAGRAVIRAEWDRDIAARTQAALKAEQAARAREQDLLIARNRSEERYAQEKRRAASDAAAARTALDGLRGELAARDRAATQDSTASRRPDGSAGLERELLGSCASTLVQLAAEADQLEARLVGLQGYVKEVCLKQ